MLFPSSLSLSLSFFWGTLFKHMLACLRLCHGSHTPICCPFFYIAAPFRVISLHESKFISVFFSNTHFAILVNVLVRWLLQFLICRYFSNYFEHFFIFLRVLRLTPSLSQFNDSFLSISVSISVSTLTFVKLVTN